MATTIPPGSYPASRTGNYFQLYDTPPPSAGSFEALANQVRAAAQQSRDRSSHARTEGLRELAASWDDLKRAASRPRPGATAEQLAALRLEAAERLATDPDVMPATGLGSEVLAELRAALPAAATTADASTQQSGSPWQSIGGWSSSPATSAIEGMVRLLYRQEWRDAHGPDMTALLTPCSTAGTLCTGTWPAAHSR